MTAPPDPLHGYYAPKKAKRRVTSDESPEHQARPLPPPLKQQPPTTDTAQTPAPVDRSASKYGLYAPQPRRPILVPTFSSQIGGSVEPQYETPPIPAPYRRVSGQSGFIPPEIQSPPDRYWGETPHSGYPESTPKRSQTALAQTGGSGYFGLPPRQPSPDALQDENNGITRRYSHSPGDLPQAPQAPYFQTSSGGIVQRMHTNTPAQPPQQQRPWHVALPSGGASNSSSPYREPTRPQTARRSKSVQWASPAGSPQSIAERGPSGGRIPPARGVLRSISSHEGAAGASPSGNSYLLEAIYKPLPPPPPPSKSPRITNPLLPSVPPSPVLKQVALQPQPPFRRPPSPALTPPPGQSSRIGTDDGITSIPAVIHRNMPVDAKRLERAREMEKMSLMSMEKEAVADEDEIVMSSTAYPGQEWAPEGLETYFEESAANVI